MTDKIVIWWKNLTVEKRKSGQIVALSDFFVDAAIFISWNENYIDKTH